jgi:hypothetical protein
MKNSKLSILEYLNNFITRWDIATGDEHNDLTKEYVSFTIKHNLPNLSADELYLEIKQGKIII